jgi:hypothetical protein
MIEMIERKGNLKPQYYTPINDKSIKGSIDIAECRMDDCSSIDGIKTCLMAVGVVVI